MFVSALVRTAATAALGIPIFAASFLRDARLGLEAFSLPMLTSEQGLEKTESVRPPTGKPRIVPLVLTQVETASFV